MHRQAIGIDIGGSSIKAAIVDLNKGCLIGDRHSVPSPAMSAVSEMLHAMSEAVPPDTASLPAGVTFPGVVVGGTVFTAANVAKSWIGQPLAEPAAAKLKRKVVAINDADAAGLAEVHFGAARDVAGTVLVLSLGTGIGSALFVDGKLVPNTELGHLEFDGMEAEVRASGAPAWSASSSGTTTCRNSTTCSIACTRCSGRTCSCCAAASPPTIRTW
jgi:polyphosphate glucokinase